VARALAARGLRVDAVSDPAAVPGGFDLVTHRGPLPAGAVGLARVRALGAALRPGGDLILRWPVAGAPDIEDVLEALLEPEHIDLDDADVVDGPDAGVALVVAHAREADAPPPPAPRVFPQSVGLLEVVAAHALTPAMRRVVVTGPGLAALRIDEPGEIITLIWPGPGRNDIVLPPVGRWRFPDEAAEQHARSYTVRAADRAARTLTIDFFLHSEPGRAADWAAAAMPGDVVGFGGTRSHWVTDPAAGWSLLLADETGLPALAAIAESRPAGHRTIAVIDTGPGEDAALPSAPGVEVHRVAQRTGHEAEATGLVGALAGLDLPVGRGQAWAAAEAAAVSAVRDHLLRVRGMSRDRVNAVAYWRRAA